MPIKLLTKILTWSVLASLVLGTLSGCGCRNTRTLEGRLVPDSELEALSEKYLREMVARQDALDLQVTLPQTEYESGEPIEVSLSLINVSDESVVIRKPDAESASVAAATENIEPGLHMDEVFFIVTPHDPSTALAFPIPPMFRDTFYQVIAPDEFHLLLPGERYRAQIPLPEPLAPPPTFERPSMPVGTYSLSAQYSNTHFGAIFLKEDDWVHIDYQAWMGSAVSNTVTFKIVPDQVGAPGFWGQAVRQLRRRFSRSQAHFARPPSFAHPGRHFGEIPTAQAVETVLEVRVATEELIARDPPEAQVTGLVDVRHHLLGPLGLGPKNQLVGYAALPTQGLMRLTEPVLRQIQPAIQQSIAPPDWHTPQTRPPGSSPPSPAGCTIGAPRPPSAAPSWETPSRPQSARHRLYPRSHPPAANAWTARPPLVSCPDQSIAAWPGCLVTSLSRTRALITRNTLSTPSSTN